MDRIIEQLRGHIIVCGIGTTGQHIVEELIITGTPFVAIDEDHARIESLAEQHGGKFLYVDGDATDDGVLKRAGLEHASGVITTLKDDRSNVYVTISARALNPDVRIVAKAVEGTAHRKLNRAGADAVVSPNYIGGVRLVHEMLNPETTRFLDELLLDRDGNRLRIEEVEIPSDSALVGRTLAQTTIRNTGALVIAVHEANGDYVYNPKGDTLLEAAMKLVVLAQGDDLTRLRKIILPT